MTPIELLNALPTLTGVEDERWFVGRREDVVGLEGQFAGPEKVGSVWIHGPRRIGKTSLMQRVRRWSRVQTHCLTPGPEWDGDDLLAHVAAEFGTDAKSLPAVLAVLKQNHVLIVEEFDRLSIRLGREQQMRLRVLAHDAPRFGWLFTSRTPPSELCEKYDEQSWLLGICTPYGLKFLEAIDVEDLVRDCWDALGWTDADAVTKEIYTRVGGHPTAVMTLIRSLIEQRAALRPNRPLPDAADCLDERGRSATLPHLESLWTDLPRDLRRNLRDGNCTPLVREWKMVDEDRKFAPGQWLLEVATDPARSDGQLPSEGLFGAAESLLDALFACNDYASRLKERRMFEHGDRQFKMFELARPSNTEAELVAFINRLAQYVCEGSPEDPENRTTGTLRAACLAMRKEPGWRALSLTRNFHDHEPGMRRTEKERSAFYFNDVDICARYAGKVRLEHSQDYRGFQLGLLRDVAASVHAAAATWRSAVLAASSPSPVPT